MTKTTDESNERAALILQRGLDDLCGGGLAEAEAAALLLATAAALARRHLGSARTASGMLTIARDIAAMPPGPADRAQLPN
jgi:hypothetical protein